MSMESDLQAWLLADAGVAAAIGDRLYRLVAAQGAVRPYAVMATLAAAPQRTLAGPTGEAVARLQLTCWGSEETAAGLADAEAARDALRTALRALEADILSYRRPRTIGTTRIRDVSDESDQELYDDEIRQPRRMIEFTVRYEE